MAALGAVQAMNLDGGGSTSLVCGGRLRNVPRESHGITLPGGRAVRDGARVPPPIVSVPEFHITEACASSPASCSSHAVAART